VPSPPFPKGYLSRGGELLLGLIRPHRCACGAELEGPPSTKRCPECRAKYKQVYHRNYLKRYTRRKKAA
jgi:hypothetical protein